MPAEDGWSYGPGLHVATDGGATWQPRLVGATVPIVAVAGQSTWAVVARCRTWPTGCTPTSYRTSNTIIYQTPGPNTPLTPLAAQVPGAGEIETLLRTDPSTAFALLADRNGYLTLGATSDSGQRWATRPLPCAGRTDQLDTQIAAAGPTSLWATCQRASGLTDELSSEMVIYRSADAGPTWQRMTPTGANVSDGLTGPQTLDVVSPLDAWAYENDQREQSAAERTTDGGAKWVDVLDGWHVTPAGGPKNNHLFRATGLTVRSTDAAAVSLWTIPPGGGTRLQLDTTTNGGRSWHLTNLPPPAGIPTTH